MYEVSVTNRGSSVFEVESKDYKFSIDTRGQGISPPAALLASLGSCVGVYLRKYCESAQLESNAFKIKVSADFGQEKPVGFRKINVSIDLEGTQIEESRKKALLDFIKKCPIHNTLSINPEVIISIS